MRPNPFEDLETALERMSKQFEETDMFEFPGFDGIAVDVLDEEERFVATADLPGYDTDHIEVTLRDDRLRIEATRELDTEEESETYLFKERRRETASRTVRLPDPVDEEAVAATYTNGVLTITLPKATDELEGHQIDIE